MSEIHDLLAEREERIDRRLLRQHGPYSIAGDGSGPSICLRCNRFWPCAEFITVDRRIDERINRTGNA